MGVSKELKEWVNKGLKKGYSKDKLRQELTKVGYSDKDITSALKETGSSPKRNPLVIGIVLIAVIIGSIYLFNALQTKGIVLEAEKDFKSGDFGVEFEPFTDYIRLSSNGYITTESLNLKELKNFEKADKINVEFIARGETGKAENIVYTYELLDGETFDNLEDSMNYSTRITLLCDITCDKTLEKSLSGQWLNRVMNERLNQEEDTFDQGEIFVSHAKFKDITVEGNKMVIRYERSIWPVVYVSTWSTECFSCKKPAAVEISSQEWETYTVQFDLADPKSDYSYLGIELSTDEENPKPVYIDQVIVSLK